MRDTKFMTSDSLKQAHSLHIYVVSGMEGNSGVEPGVGLSSGDELLPQPTGPKLIPAASGRSAAIRALIYCALYKPHPRTIQAARIGPAKSPCRGTAR